MRVILVEEKDIRTLMERLELEKFQCRDRYTSEELREAMQMHRHFHYVVVSWLQEQGSSYPN